MWALWFHLFRKQAISSKSPDPAWRRLGGGGASDVSSSLSLFSTWTTWRGFSMEIPVFMVLYFYSESVFSPDSAANCGEGREEQGWREQQNRADVEERFASLLICIAAFPFLFISLILCFCLCFVSLLLFVFVSLFLFGFLLIRTITLPITHRCNLKLVPTNCQLGCQLLSTFVISSCYPCINISQAFDKDHLNLVCLIFPLQTEVAGLHILHLK